MYGAASDTLILWVVRARVSHIFERIAIAADKVKARSAPSAHDSNMWKSPRLVLNMSRPGKSVAAARNVGTWLNAANVFSYNGAINH